MNNVVLKLTLYWKNAALLSSLLLGLLLLLLLPTMKSIRTVEINPDNSSFTPEPNQLIAQHIKIPAAPIDYVIVWVFEKNDSTTPTKADYTEIELTISPSNNSLREVQTATTPTYIMREGRPALLFPIKKLRANDGDRFDIRLTYSGNKNVLLHRSLNAQVKTGESALAAFQLAQKKNWLTSLIDKVYAENLIGNDIAMYLHRGQQIAAGTNPYACVLEKGACIGYPAHTPGMYLIASGFVFFGVHDLASWAAAWRPFAIATWLIIGIVLLAHITRRGQIALAVAALGFWLFNRWSLDVLRIAHTDFLGVLFLLLAVLFVEKRQKTAALMFGISLAIKQVAILVLPLFLMYLWRNNSQSFKKLAMLAGLVILVPLLTLAPFLIDNAPATITGLLNPLARPAQQVHGFASSFAQFVDITNISKVFLMTYLIGIIYIAAYKKSISLVGGMLMIFAIMISFTDVLYNQYIVWLLPFIPLAVSAYCKHDTSN